ncbi:protein DETOXIFICATION 46, chloroplastic isoform X2 [Physcomitrium patens]|nr:protein DETOXIFICATION 46, chloroplastic-like isoform X2 [Physcomitrium patens]|eukprot:XP_024356560.1 protein DETOXIFICATION 46, chloroplastic-like isoform X2 [Physcomitrella patens]
MHEVVHTIMQSMVGIQFSRPSSPSRCISIGSCPSFQPPRRIPYYLGTPTFQSARKFAKFIPLTPKAMHSEHSAGEEMVNLQPGDDSTSKDLDSASTGRKAEDEEESVLTSIVNLAVPALGAVLSDPIMSLIDTGCVGQVSSVHLAALGPNTSIFNFIFQLFTFLGSATCNLLAGINLRASSVEEQRTQQHQASQLLNHALFLAVTFGVGVFFLMEAFAPKLLALMGTGPEYLKPALVYLRVRALSAPAVLILIVGQGACLGRQDATTPLRINSMAAFLNLIGDAIFTLYLGWGVGGAAWATLLSQCVAVILLVRNLTGKSTQRIEGEQDFSQAFPLKLGWYGLPTSENLGPFLALAGPLILRSVLGMTVYTLTTKGAAQFGTLSVAAHQVALQVFWTLSYFPESLSIAAQSLVARNVKTNPQRAQKVARMLLGFGGVLGVALMGVVASVHYLGSSWLTADPNVQHLVQSVTLQNMLCELLCSLALVVEGTAIAAGENYYLTVIKLMHVA